MKKIALVVLSVLIIVWFVYFMRDWKTTIENTSTGNTSDKWVVLLNGTKSESWALLYNKTNCDIKDEPLHVNGTSMEPMIKNMSEVSLKMNYYNCGKNVVKWWDIVVFENPHTKELVIKKLAIVPGDKIVMNRKEWTIKINGTTFVNSEKKEYKFTENEMKWFDIYTSNWIVSEWIYFIFWDNILNSTDSRRYGPIPLEWILGKVEL